MDPTETLRQFWAAYKSYDDCEGGNSHERQVNALTAAERAADLFEWLARGGFPPDWTITDTKGGDR